MEDKPIIDAYIMNLGKYVEGYDVGEWIALPTTEEKLKEVYDRIGIGEQYEEIMFGDYDSDLFGVIKEFGEHENLELLNYVAGVIEDLSPSEREKYEAVLESGLSLGDSGIVGLINLAYNLDKYDVLPDITDEYDLGRYYAEETVTARLGDLAEYFDYKSYGSDCQINESGMFTDAGYVLDNGTTWDRYFSGQIEDIPEDYRLSGKEGTEIGQENAFAKEIGAREPASENHHQDNSISGISVDGHEGTWKCIEEFSVLDSSYFLMESEKYGKGANLIVVDCRGELVAEDITPEQIAAAPDIVYEVLRSEEEAMEVPVEPDRTIGKAEMQNYGYEWGGMLPVREEKAEKIYDADVSVYALFEDGTEAQLASREHIVEHGQKGGIFGIEKKDWMKFLNQNSLEKVEELLEDDYGMIDGIINNGSKSEKEADKNKSVMEKLSECKEAVKNHEKNSSREQRQKHKTPDREI